MLDSTISTVSKANSCSHLSTHMMMEFSFSDVKMDQYLSEKNAALSPLDEIEEIEKENDNSEEYNEDVIIYSNRSDSSIYDPALSKFLKTNTSLYF